MLYVGIDQALRKIGVCVLANEKVHLAFIKPPPNLRKTRRLTALRDALQQYLEPWKGQLAHAALEAQALGSCGDLDQLGHINGIVQIVLADMGVKEPLTVPPALLKKFVAGNGQARKDHMISSTKQLWNLVIEQDDLCDAHGLARIAKEFIEKKSPYRYQIEVIHRLRVGKKKRTQIKKIHIQNL